ncbi:MAG: LETM1 domain-containing protein [Flavobacteriales bacterium]|jgi:DNA-binding ferritin-like protein (Dps family)|nr:LETM1 domain-containing protein [Flavobacteriales bacterium]
MKDKADLSKEELHLLEKRGAKEFARKLGENSKKASKAMRLFLHNMGTEAKETKEASKILVKFLREGKVEQEEEEELKQQVYDLLKMVGIGVPFFLIPGSSLLIPFLMKIAEKRGVNLFPSAFSKDEEE